MPAQGWAEEHADIHGPRSQMTAAGFGNGNPKRRRICRGNRTGTGLRSNGSRPLSPALFPGAIRTERNREQADGCGKANGLPAGPFSGAENPKERRADKESDLSRTVRSRRFSMNTTYENGRGKFPRPFSYHAANGTNKRPLRRTIAAIYGLRTSTSRLNPAEDETPGSSRW